MEQALINKFKEISSNSEKLQLNSFNFQPSKESLALDVWRAISPLERLEVMNQVEYTSRLKAYQSKCLKVIEKYI